MQSIVKILHIWQLNSKIHRVLKPDPCYILNNSDNCKPLFIIFRAHTFHLLVVLCCEIIKNSQSAEYFGNRNRV